MEKNINKVKLHMDEASNHRPKSNVAYLGKKSLTGIKCVPFKDIPVKSPDASPWLLCIWLVKVSFRKMSSMNTERLLEDCPRGVRKMTILRKVYHQGKFKLYYSQKSMLPNSVILPQEIHSCIEITHENYSRK